MTTSRQHAADYIAAIPEQRRNCCEKILVGHSRAEDECLRFVPTLPYVDYDLKLTTLPEESRPSWQTCLRDILQACAEFLHVHYGYNRDRTQGDYEDFAVMSACVSDKISFHLVLRGASIADRGEWLDHLKAYRASRVSGWGTSMQENPDLAPYGRTQDFRLPLNSKRPGARNFLVPLEELTGSHGSPRLKFAKWPMELNERILFGMVCNVPSNAKKIAPIIQIPPRAGWQRRGDDGPSQRGLIAKQPASQFTNAIMQVPTINKTHESHRRIEQKHCAHNNRQSQKNKDSGSARLGD